MSVLSCVGVLSQRQNRRADSPFDLQMCKAFARPGKGGECNEETDSRSNSAQVQISQSHAHLDREMRMRSQAYCAGRSNRPLCLRLRLRLLTFD